MSIGCGQLESIQAVIEKTIGKLILITKVKNLFCDADYSLDCIIIIYRYWYPPAVDG